MPTTLHVTSLLHMKNSIAVFHIKISHYSGYPGETVGLRSKNNGDSIEQVRDMTVRNSGSSCTMGIRIEYMDPITIEEAY